MIGYTVRIAILSIIILFCVILRAGVVRAEPLGFPKAGEPGLIVASETAIINRPIDGDNLTPISKWLLWKLYKGDKSVNLVINSAGGSVTTGLEFIARLDYVVSRGLKVRCYVVDRAQSMAFLILLHCSERHATEHSDLLWHRAATVHPGGVIQGVEARIVADDLEVTDALFIKDLLRMPMPKAEIMRHLENQTHHIAINLNRMAPGLFTSVKPSYPGLFEADSNPSKCAVVQSSPAPEGPDLLHVDLKVLNPKKKINQ